MTRIGLLLVLGIAACASTGDDTAGDASREAGQDATVDASHGLDGSFVPFDAGTTDGNGPDVMRIEDAGFMPGFDGSVAFDFGGFGDGAPHGDAFTLFPDGSSIFPGFEGGFPFDFGGPPPPPPPPP